MKDTQAPYSCGYLNNKTTEERRLTTLLSFLACCTKRYRDVTFVSHHPLRGEFFIDEAAFMLM